MPLPDMLRGSDHTLLRVLHYPPLLGAEEPDAVRAAAHTDINLLTLLPAATEPGLQIRLQDGSWLDVPCDFGLLIVNIGDMLAEASGHHFPSTVHQVLNPTGVDRAKRRISLPLFLHPHREVCCRSATPWAAISTSACGNCGLWTNKSEAPDPAM